MILLQTIIVRILECLSNFTALFTCTRGDARLAGGETSYEGIVEICLSGSWVSVCDSSSWNVNESTVVCRQLTGELDPSKKLLLRRSVIIITCITFVYLT